MVFFVFCPYSFPVWPPLLFSRLHCPLRRCHACRAPLSVSCAAAVCPSACTAVAAALSPLLLLPHRLARVLAPLPAPPPPPTTPHTPPIQSNQAAAARIHAISSFIHHPTRSRRDSSHFSLATIQYTAPEYEPRIARRSARISLSPKSTALLISTPDRAGLCACALGIVCLCFAYASIL